MFRQVEPSAEWRMGFGETLLGSNPADIVYIGIGENGHIAF